jgi:hypothetical protein
VSSERDVKTSDSVVISGRAYRSQVVGAMASKATVRAIFRYGKPSLGLAAVAG